MTKIYPVILAGGSGARLWPLSRKSYPKQFSELIGKKSLFQETVLRLKSSEITEFEPPITLTNSDFRFIVTEQMYSVGIEPGPILIEPSSRNTAPAILAASIYANGLNDEAILVVAPSDHVIADTSAFHAMLNIGISQAEIGKIVTFGIKPTKPETGYGYLELDEADDCSAMKVKRFIEKPEKDVAESMLLDDRYLWNAGIFMFRAKDLISSFARYAPAILENVREAVVNGKPDLSFFRLQQESWNLAENISIDYAIMEVDEIKEREAVEIPHDMPRGHQWKKDFSIMSKTYYTGFPNGMGPFTIDGNVVGYNENDFLYIKTYGWSGCSGAGIFGESGRLVAYAVALTVGQTQYGTNVAEDILIAVPLFKVNWPLAIMAAKENENETK